MCSILIAIFLHCGFFLSQIYLFLLEKFDCSSGDKVLFTRFIVSIMSTNTETSSFDYENYYRNYWEIMSFEKKVENRYFEKLYDRIKDKLKVDPGCTAIIDVGGGDGGFSYYMGLRGDDVTIFDISDSGLKFAKESLGFNKVIKGNVLDLQPIADSSYDFAYCMEVAEHLDNPNLMFQNINRILKPGGKLIVAVPNEKIDGVHHKKRWKTKELVQDLEKAGFELEWMDNNPRFYHPHPNPIANFLHKFLPTSVKFWLCRTMPDIFAAMQIVKVVKK